MFDHANSPGMFVHILPLMEECRCPSASKLILFIYCHDMMPILLVALALADPCKNRSFEISNQIWKHQPVSTKTLSKSKKLGKLIGTGNAGFAPCVRCQPFIRWAKKLATSTCDGSGAAWLEGRTGMQISVDEHVW